ncbi:pectate lyase [Armatimonas sp.]|uniref:pectate lyase n=1 Tax=Armatimonas sp. TaxID=1872638 RepID=UPI003752BFCC
MFRQNVTWKTILAQPTAWYKSPEAQKIAANVLLYQHSNGGWEKNLDMVKPPKTPPKETTIDNGATTTQLTFLARVGTPECRAAALKAIEYLLAAQYPNGGWPQFWPLKKGYYTHITFNDDAMARVLTVLREIAQGKPDYAFVDAAQQQKCATAVTKGVACILKCQVVLQGKKTLWCAQHDEVSFAPAKARAYELPSLSGSESVDVLRFLMGEKPTPPVAAAIEGGIAWLKANQLTGIRIEKQGDDKVVVSDPSADPCWGRFYDLETGKPFFCGRDGIKKNSLAEIEKERRTGYSWYTNRGNQLLKDDYPTWKKRKH